MYITESFPAIATNSPQNDNQAIANRELIEYLDRQSNTVAPEIPSLVPRRIQVEKIGLTKNAANTPYMVYWVGQQRCSLFFRRKLLWQLLQEFLNITSKIRSVVVTEHFDLNVLIGDKWRLIFKPHFIKFVERWNNRQQDAVAATPESNLLKGFNNDARGAKAWARNAKVIEMYRYQQRSQKQQQEVEAKTVSPEVEKLAIAMRSAIANSNWEILTETLYGREQYKAQAWQQLSPQEREQLAELTPPEVRMLAQARKSGKIAAFVEHTSGGMFSVWLKIDSEPQPLSSTAVAGFLQGLA